MLHRAVAALTLAALGAVLGGCGGGPATGSTNTPDGTDAGTGGPGASISAAGAGDAALELLGITLVGSSRVGRTTFDYTYIATVRNRGTAAFTGVSGSVTSAAGTTTVTDAGLQFPDLAPGSSAQSSDTFTIRQDRTAPVSDARLTIALSGSAAGTGPGEGVVLAGPPAAPVLDAITDMVPLPARDADIVDGVILTRLGVALDPTATVGTLNAALATVGGGIVGMAAGVPALSVAVPRQRDLAALRQLASLLAAQPGIAGVIPGRQGEPDVLPPGSAGLEPISAHLRATRFPAAWNAKALLANCGSDKVQVLVADYFGTGSEPGYEDYATQLPGVAASGSGSPAPEGPSGKHGYNVLATLAAAGLEPTDGALPTGAVPFPACLVMRVVNLHALDDVATALLLALELPAGKAVLNASFGFRKCLDPCGPAEVASVPGAYDRALAGAIQRRALRRFTTDALLVSSAGNNGNKDVRLIYPGAADASYNSSLNVAARSDSGLTWTDDRDQWAPPPCPFPSCPPQRDLTATAAELQSLASWLAQNGETTAAPAPNVLIVGATDRAGAKARLSSPTGDVFAVGVDLPMYDGEIDSGTSYSAPQVAGLAAYLWLLSPELRSRPVADTIAAIRANATPGDVRQVDAYASVLALDAGFALSRSQSRIRMALLDADNSGFFNDADLALFRAAYVDNDVPLEPAVADHGRYDLNGDGYSGGRRTTAFDLDPGTSPRFGRATLTSVSENVFGLLVTFDEAAVTDADVLCFYAHGPLFTGSPEGIEANLADLCRGPDDTYAGRVTEAVQDIETCPAGTACRTIDNRRDWDLRITRQADGRYLPSGTLAVTDVTRTDGVVCSSGAAISVTVTRTGTLTVVPAPFFIDAYAVQAAGNLTETRSGKCPEENVPDTVVRSTTVGSIASVLSSWTPDSGDPVPEFDGGEAVALTWDVSQTRDFAEPSGKTVRRTRSMAGRLRRVP